MLYNKSISIYEDKKIVYSNLPPYNPNIEYPEYPFVGKNYIDINNHVYNAVRESLHLLNLDSSNWGSLKWNPFRDIIKAGNSVVIKPNAVFDINFKSDESIFASITHGSILRPVIDYTYKSLDGSGKIIIADSPLMHSNFDNWMKLTGINSIIDLYKKEFGFHIDVFDLRKEIAPWDVKNNFAPSNLRHINNGDPDGYLDIDIGNNSEFACLNEHDIQLFYGSDYNRNKTIKHHLNNHHIYNVSKTFLNADTIISVPKLKVHSKVGVTLNIKGMVGTQGDKNYIPHHKIGPASLGGDEYPDLGFIQNSLNMYRSWLICNILSKENKICDYVYKPLNIIHTISQSVYDKFEKIRFGDNYIGNITGGSWYGNDTTWRTALDLTHTILYSDKNGKLCDTPQRNFFSIIDGIIGGERDGPLSPTCKYCGVIIAGFNPLFVDTAAARLMGFDPSKIRMLHEGWLKSWLSMTKSTPNELFIKSNNSNYELLFSNTKNKYLNYLPPKGWIGHIEI